MPRFVANLSMMFTEVPLIECSAAARKAGLDAMGFLSPHDYFPQRAQQQLMQDHLMLALSSTAPGDINTGGRRLSASPRREHEARANIDLALEYALAPNCERAHVMSGAVPAGEDVERYRAVFVDDLRYVADRFALRGKRILAEALSPGVEPHHFFSSQYQVLTIVEEAARGNVLIQLDTFHVQKVDGNLTHLIRSYAGRYTHMQITGPPDRHEPDDGEVNYPWLFRLFDEVGYQGRISYECRPRGLAEKGSGWFDARR